MGYRGKVAEQERARELRAQGWTMKEIRDELGVSLSSVSLWVREVPVDEAVWARRVRENRRFGARKRTNRLSVKRHAEIERLRAEGRERIGRLSERDFLIAGVALYAGEGGKTEGEVSFPNTNAEMLTFFLAWLRHFFAIDEARLRVRLYLHEGLDLDAATTFWSAIMGVPLAQFTKAYRAPADPTIRRSKHPMGCPCVRYGCVHTHRAVMGLVEALLSCDLQPSGVAQ